MENEIEIIFLDDKGQRQIFLPFESDLTIDKAIEKSGILSHLSPIEREKLTYGIFSKCCDSTVILSPGDRVEIYRPLLIDPKAKRRLLASKKHARAPRVNKDPRIRGT